MVETLTDKGTRILEVTGTEKGREMLLREIIHQEMRLQLIRESIQEIILQEIILRETILRETILQETIIREMCLQEKDLLEKDPHRDREKDTRREIVVTTGLIHPEGTEETLHREGRIEVKFPLIGSVMKQEADPDREPRRGEIISMKMDLGLLVLAPGLLLLLLELPIGQWIKIKKITE